MDARVLGLVIVFAFSLVLAFGQTRDDLERKLNDAKNHLNKDIPEATLEFLIQITKDYLNQPGISSLATQCIYEKSKWYLKMYFDPLMQGFINYESLRIKDFEDQINDADFSNATAINQLYGNIAAAVNTFDKDLQIWKEFVSPTGDMIEGIFKACLNQN